MLAPPRTPAVATSVLALIVLAPAILAPTTVYAQLDLRVRADAPGDDERNLNGEYVVVSNEGTTPVDVSGWQLCDAVKDCFVFPEGTSIGPGGDLRVYTGSGRDTLTAVYMGFEHPIWANWADVASLRDASGELRARCAWDRGEGRDCSPP